jgi:sugar transferase (PEP-CTERM/EpsH1 system associated)
MELLFLSHCVPNPPNKGEKIRAYHEISALARRHPVHLVCFARERAELQDADKLHNLCSSVQVFPLFPFPLRLGAAGVRFLAGQCLNSAFYSSRAMAKYVRELYARHRIGCAVAYSAVMARYVPQGARFVLDMQDVDSEKWLQYALERKPSFLFKTEAARIRKLEVAEGRRASISLFTTHAEEMLFRSFAGECRTGHMENGVRLDYFRPSPEHSDPSLAGRRYLLFVGTMDYFPNADAVCRFARGVFGELRSADPGLEFLIVGRNPTAEVRALGSIEGVEVVGEVQNIRPYLSHATAVVAPLQIARGIQNKVLEALAMGKPVLASEPVVETFGPQLPPGVMRCVTAADLQEAMKKPIDEGEIRAGVIRRFDWQRNLETLSQAVEETSHGISETR